MSVGIAFSTRVLVVLVAMGVALQANALTLQEAFESAVKAEPALRASKYNKESVEENIAIARSRLLPQISIQGSTNQLTQTTSQDVPGGSSISRSFTGPSATHQLVVRQSLFRPKDLAELSYAELQAEYAELKYQSDLSELWLRVTDAWIDLIGAKQLVEVQLKPLQILNDAAKQEAAKFAQGDSTRDLVAEVEAQFHFANAAYQQTLHTLNIKQRTFELLTKIEATSLEGKRLNMYPQPLFTEMDRAQVWQRKRDNSFDLRLSEVQLLIQRERIRMVRADHLPTLDILASWGSAKNDATSTQGYRYTNNQIGIQYVVPIYNGGAISAAERQAHLAMNATLADGEAISNRFENDFQLTWSTWLGQQARLQAGYKLIESSKEQLSASSRSFVHGVKSIADVANSEIAHMRRNIDQINLSMEYYKYLARISKNDFSLD